MYGLSLIFLVGFFVLFYVYIFFASAVNFNLYKLNLYFKFINILSEWVKAFFSYFQFFQLEHISHLLQLPICVFCHFSVFLLICGSTILNIKNSQFGVISSYGYGTNIFSLLIYVLYFDCWEIQIFSLIQFLHFIVSEFPVLSAGILSSWHFLGHRQSLNKI